ncbi:hypothetical protein PG995_006817 [Apiospora arundinis]
MYFQPLKSKHLPPSIDIRIQHPFSIFSPLTTRQHQGLVSIATFLLHSSHSLSNAYIFVVKSLSYHLLTSSPSVFIIMKFSVSASILALAASAVHAQAPQNQTGPFFLHITGKDNKTIDGYGGACHAGAAIEGLCFDNGPRPDGDHLNYASFYFNYTGDQDVDGSEVGVLSWNLQLASGSDPAFVPSPMSFTFPTTSNVAQPMFGTSSSTGGQPVGFDKDGKLFAYGYLDDSTFQPGVPPNPSSQAKAYYNWFVCWQSFSAYYYNAVGWATSLPPHNPTCQAVEIHQVLI